MAFDFNSVKFLLWAKNLGVSFDRTLTLGHQGLCCSPRQLHRASRNFGLQATPEEINRCFEHVPFTALYSDEFLRLLGAKNITIVDYSDFEGASLLHDLNKPFPEELRQSFDLVIDGGTLEHVFDYPKALSHCMELIRPGGHMISISPASGQMGHGFYQFSPELFFRAFSKERGFTVQKIILFDCAKIDSSFYEVKDPARTGLRTQSIVSKALQIAVLAKKTSHVSNSFDSPPQQSDYSTGWENSTKMKTKKTDSGLIWQLRVALNPYWPHWLRRWRDYLVYRRVHGWPSLNDPRHFRRLSKKEIFEERLKPETI